MTVDARNLDASIGMAVLQMCVGSKTQLGDCLAQPKSRGVACMTCTIRMNTHNVIGSHTIKGKHSSHMRLFQVEHLE